ncbi:MAG: sulfotransferase family 2 domain-containing protein [Bacteroidota bacterium]
MKIKFIEKYKNIIGLYFNSPLHKGNKKDFIFIHINKTAGTSVIDIIGKPFRKHLTAREIIDHIGKKKWDTAYKFSVVRNPFDKMVSHYKHRIKTNPKVMINRLEGKKNEKEFISFKKWIEVTLGENKVKFYYNRPQHFLPQTEWLKDYDGNIKIDTIVRFENLNEGFDKVSQDLGLESKLPHLNRTLKSNYRDFYDEETKILVSEWFYEDINYFGYKF